MAFADSKGILKRQQQHEQRTEGEEATSRKVALHKPCAAAFSFARTFDSSRHFHWESVGESCAQEMIVGLNRLAGQRVVEMREDARMIMKEDDWRACRSATCCQFCGLG